MGKNACALCDHWPLNIERIVRCSFMEMKLTICSLWSLSRFSTICINVCCRSTKYSPPYIVHCELNGQYNMATDTCRKAYDSSSMYVKWIAKCFTRITAVKCLWQIETIITHQRANPPHEWSLPLAWRQVHKPIGNVCNVIFVQSNTQNGNVHWWVIYWFD